MYNWVLKFSAANCSTKSVWIFPIHKRDKRSILLLSVSFKGFPGGSVVKNPPANAGDAGSIPGSGRSSGEGNDNPLQYSCLEDSMDRGAQRATDHGIAESDTTE